MTIALKHMYLYVEAIANMMLYLQCGGKYCD